MPKSDSIVALPLPVALVCFSAFALSMFSSFNWAAQPHEFAPIVTQYLGRFTYLTVQVCEQT
jgi:hypothetical protein